MLRPYADAARALHLFGPKAPAPSHPVPGLPNLPRLPGHRRDSGGTTTHLVNPRPYSEVIGHPSMRVERTEGGGVQTILKRNAKAAEFMTAEDFRKFGRILEQVKAEAVRLSMGPLSLKELRRRGHPYGRGGIRGRIARSGRAGIPSLAVVNKQSGELARSWDIRIKRGKSGADFILENTARHAAFTALGTKRMKAHGPETAALQRQLNKLDAAWRVAAKEAWLRQQLMGGQG